MTTWIADQRRRQVTLLALVALLGGGLSLSWHLAAPPTIDPALRFDRGDNGLWLRRHWIHGGAEVDPEALARSLEALGVGRIYPFLGPMDHAGWPGWREGDQIRRYDPARAAAFFAAMDRAAPGVKVLPWTGGVLGRDVGLTDEVQRAAFARHAARLVALGADGVQINVEPMPSFSPGYLELLRAVKAAIGPDKVLSVAAYPPPTALHPFEDVHWTLEFTREVCLVADEVVVMGYDTALRSRRLYRSLVARWTRELAEALPPPEAGGCQWSMGLSAYEDDEGWHDPEVETLEQGLLGVLEGLRGRPAPANLTGVAIYASWTTDAAEWATYERLWRRRPPSGVTVADRG